MYEFFEQILQIRHMTASEVCKLTGINSSTISTWKKRNSVLDARLLQKIAKVLDCTIDDLMGSGRIEWNPETQEIVENDTYYLDAEAREIAQFLFENPGHRVLFDASRKIKPEDLNFASRALNIFVEMGEDDEQ